MYIILWIGQFSAWFLSYIKPQNCGAILVAILVLLTIGFFAVWH